MLPVSCQGPRAPIVISKVFRSSDCVAVVADSGIPLVRYSVLETERLIEDLVLRQRRAEKQGDIQGSRFFRQWVADLRSAVEETKAEGSSDRP